MKSTLTMGKIANPRRTTLAHLNDADELTARAVEADAVREAAQEAAREAAQNAEDALPSQTANPRRTTLVDAPAS
ncbi:hypothetical protein MMF93_24150 [Streptomyces tubbatahanensis]|uniref:Uncharacterized protein n=1 Tax=Streptomyces tubbatahanensis TaxID=2923272 RepID=A0ABY3XXH1_9ACTN|nr:hypothetical protein [Streptomyces tubbatahanensis]UNS99206.1 hypothetical protein MMF93_24150 [Streptomyces tubbatahanensis]